MHVEFSEEIPLPASHIYAFMRTPADWTRLYGSFGEVRDRGDGWYAVPLRRSPFPLVARIMQDDPDRRVCWEFGGVWSGDGEVRLLPIATGTLVTGHETLRLPHLFGVGPMVERHLLESQFLAIWEAGWRRLRRMATADDGTS